MKWKEAKKIRKECRKQVSCISCKYCKWDAFGSYMCIKMDRMQLISPENWKKKHFKKRLIFWKIAKENF
jgi:hypothetical protein